MERERERGKSISFAEIERITMAPIKFLTPSGMIYVDTWMRALSKSNSGRKQKTRGFSFLIKSEAITFLIYFATV